MAIGIGQESSIMSMLTNDVDLYRYKYRDYEEQIDGSKIHVSFVSPIFSVFEKYRFYLLQNSEKVKLEPKWKYRPDYVSYEKYGNTAWWQLLLWINDVKSIEYFNSEEIIVPTADAVAKLEMEAYSVDQYIDINEDAKHSKTTFTLYKHPTNNINNLKKQFNNNGGTTETETTEEKQVKFCREVFTMEIPILRLKYIDLTDVPEENSIRVCAKCRPNLIFGKHYTLVEGSNGLKNRITWDPKIIQNSGLLFKLKENDVMEVQYVTNE